MKSDWAKPLGVALEEFLKNGHEPWTAKDKSKILAVVEELGLIDGKFAFNKSHVFDVEPDKEGWRDQGILHIYPTFLMAQKPFKGSFEDRKPSHPHHPHRYELEHWVDRSSPMKKGSLPSTVLCPQYNIHVNPGIDCSYCGEIHS